MKTERFTEKIIKNLDKLDRKSIENVVRNLQDEQQLIQTIFNRLPEGIIFLNDQLEVILINESAREILALSENQDVKGSLEKVIQNPNLIRFLKENLKYDKRVLHQEFQLSSGRERLILLNLYPFFNQKDEKIGTVITLWDVTEKDRLQKDFFNFERVESILKLAAGVAHEIGNPLNAIQIHLKLLEKQTNKKSQKEFKEILTHIAAIQEEVSRIDKIVRHFLDASRQKFARFKSAQLNTLISQTLARFQYELKDKKIRSQMHLDPKLPNTLLDAEKIEHLLTNLIRNAIQAMPRGGKLNITTQVKGPAILMSIKDTGEGISKEDIPQIFEPFYTTKTEGSGLGLMIVLDIVREHGGKIDVSSEKEKGTIMTVAFPVRREKPLIAFQEKKS